MRGATVTPRVLVRGESITLYSRWQWKYQMSGECGLAVGKTWLFHLPLFITIKMWGWGLMWVAKIARSAINCITNLMLIKCLPTGCHRSWFRHSHIRNDHKYVKNQSVSLSLFVLNKRLEGRSNRAFNVQRWTYILLCQVIDICRYCLEPVCAFCCSAKLKNIGAGSFQGEDFKTVRPGGA